MTAHSAFPSTIILAPPDDIVTQAMAVLVYSDPSRYWYRRLAVAAGDLRLAAAASCRIDVPGDEVSYCTAWMIGSGLLVTSGCEPAIGSTIRFISGDHGTVRGVLRSDTEPGVTFVRVTGKCPASIPVAREAADTPDVLVIGWDRERVLAFGRYAHRESGPTLEVGSQLPPGARGAPIISLSLGEVVGMVLDGGAVLPVERLIALAEVLNAGALSARTLLEQSGEEALGLERRVDPSEYDDRTGYDEDFIGVPVRLPKPRARGPLEGDILEYGTTAKGKTGVLPYTHFSVVMSRSRRLSMFTAVNIAGRTLQSLDRGGDVWQLDSRIPDEAQFDNDLYVNNDLDRGHMVRRLDPVWGDEAEAANMDTFHYTNSCPQHKDLNQKIWNDLEEYILQNTGKEELKVNVFTGPVFSDDDPPYRGAKIPLQFWKVVTMIRPDDGHLSATAYILSQADMVEGLEFVFGEFRTYQLPIVKLEALTHLDFGTLRDHDPKRGSDEGLESLGSGYTPITRPKDLVL